MLPLDEKEVCALFRPAFFACSAVISWVHFGWIGNRELENRARDNPGCRVTGALPSVITSLWYRHQIKTSSEEPYLKKKKRKEKNSAENPCRSKCLSTYKFLKKNAQKNVYACQYTVTFYKSRINLEMCTCGSCHIYRPLSTHIQP